MNTDDTFKKNVLLCNINREKLRTILLNIIDNSRLGPSYSEHARLMTIEEMCAYLSLDGLKNIIKINKKN